MKLRDLPRVQRAQSGGGGGEGSQPPTPTQDNANENFELMLLRSSRLAEDSRIIGCAFASACIDQVYLRSRFIQEREKSKIVFRFWRDYIFLYFRYLNN